MTQRIRPHAIDQGQGPFEVPRIASGTVVVYEESTPLGNFDQLRFVGAGVTVTDQGPYAEVSIPGGGGAGGAGLMFTEEGVPLGTGTRLDSGYGLDLSISGTTVRIEVAAPITGSVIVSDEGVRQGSALDLDFVGAGVSASISGSRAQISIPGGGATNPPITGSIVVSDEGAVKGSALDLDFVGPGVSASISGSRAQIAIPGESNRSLNFIVGDGESLLTTGTKGLVRAGFHGRIRAWEVVSAGAVTGSVSFNLRRTAYPFLFAGLTGIIGVPPAPPFISGTVKNNASGTALAGWNTDFYAEDFFEILVNGFPSGVRLVTLALDALVL